MVKLVDNAPEANLQMGHDKASNPSILNNGAFPNRWAMYLNKNTTPS